jgi:hypothetical protein
MFTEFTAVGDSVHFEVHGQAYDFDVVKERTLTRLGGDGWKNFLTRNPLSYGDQMIVFSYGGETPKISVLYFQGGDLKPFELDIISKVCKLSECEHNHLLQIVSSAKTFVGFPFVTRLKRKNLARHSMVFCSFKLFFFLICVHNLWQLSNIITLLCSQKLPNKVVSHLPIPKEGLAGLLVVDDDGPVSRLVEVPYEIVDGRLIFNKFAWRAFHIEEDDLQVGQAVLITARTTSRPGTNIMFFFDILTN